MGGEAGGGTIVTAVRQRVANPKGGRVGGMVCCMRYVMCFVPGASFFGGDSPQAPHASPLHPF
eukprot:3116973-Alexandrium_andersonii.AAC.1